MEYKKVLVTGGSGFLGRRLRRVKPDWIYIGSKQADLTEQSQCEAIISEHKPDAVVHLAARVGGIKENANNPADFFCVNVKINTNVVEACRKVEVKRLLSSLSTCAYPDVLCSYPFNESSILDGPPAPTNLPYGFSKRLLYIQTNAYRQQYGLNYSVFCPSNLYGPEDNYDLETSHFVAAVIRKISEAVDGDEVEIWGTGKPLRQQLYVDDLAMIIPKLLSLHTTDSPLIVAPNENLSIAAMVAMCLEISQKNIAIKYNGKLDGQYRKDGTNERFLTIYPEFEFTSFFNGARKTYEWYNENSIHNRN